MTTEPVAVEDIEATVNLLVNDYVRIYRLSCVAEINNGYCGDFADDLGRIFKGSAFLCKVPSEFYKGVHYSHLAHFWVVIGDLYVDAEVPRGVYDWRQLPFFQRAKDFMSSAEKRELFGPAFENLPSCLDA